MPVWLTEKAHESLSIFSCSVQFSSIQSLSRVRLFATPWIATHQASLSITNSRSSLRLTSIESVTPSSHLIFCRPLLFLPQSLPASESFPMSQLFAWGGQSTGVSALASFLPKKSQGWSHAHYMLNLSKGDDSASNLNNLDRKETFLFQQRLHPQGKL